MDGASITSTGSGLYIAGYSTFNIGDAYIEGELAAIGIKSGKLIIDGATLICNGDFIYLLLGEILLFLNKRETTYFSTSQPLNMKSFSATSLGKV